MLLARDILIFLALHYDGDWDHIYQAIISKEQFSSELMKATLDNNKNKAITIFDEDYPSSLKNIYKPPFVLFYEGELSYLKDINQMIGVVGSRNCKDYGEEMTKKIVSELSSNYVIVSGLAKGIDAVAHQAALDNGGRTVAVLGSGIDNCYPLDNAELYEKIKESHLLISEYPGKAVPDRIHFPMRNRIIAGLVSGLVVTEAYAQSGTLITVGFALENGKDIMCVPYSSRSKSECNRLIKEGASLVESGEDVINALNRKW